MNRKGALREDPGWLDAIDLDDRGAGNRKRNLRDDPGWLDNLDLEDPEGPGLPPPATPTRRGTIARNAAEEWNDRLPDPGHLAILERRRELDRRTYEPEPPPPRITNLGPPRRQPIDPRKEATRNAALLTLGVLGIGFAISRIRRKDKPSGHR